MLLVELFRALSTVIVAVRYCFCYVCVVAAVVFAVVVVVVCIHNV